MISALHSKPASCQTSFIHMYNTARRPTVALWPCLPPCLPRNNDVLHLSCIQNCSHVQTLAFSRAHAIRDFTDMKPLMQNLPLLSHLGVGSAAAALRLELQAVNRKTSYTHLSVVRCACYESRWPRTWHVPNLTHLAIRGVFQLVQETREILDRIADASKLQASGLDSTRTSGYLYPCLCA